MTERQKAQSNRLPLIGELVLDPIMCQIFEGNRVVGALTPLQSRALESLVSDRWGLIPYQYLHQMLYPEARFAWGDIDLSGYELRRVQAVVQGTRRRLEEIRPGLGNHLQTLHARAYRWNPWLDED